MRARTFALEVVVADGEHHRRSRMRFPNGWATADASFLYMARSSRVGWRACDETFRFGDATMSSKLAGEGDFRAGHDEQEP